MKRVVMAIVNALILFPLIAIAQNVDNTPEKSLQNYVNSRLNLADWSVYSKFITWDDEPSWDCYWVSDSVQYGSTKKSLNNAIIPTTINRIGLLCNNNAFEEKHSVVTINYRLVRKSKRWLIDGPDPDYPDIDAQFVVKRYEANEGVFGDTTVRRNAAQQPGYPEIIQKIRAAITGRQNNN